MTKIDDFLARWHYPLLTDSDLIAALEGTAAQRHSLVSRSLKKGEIVALRRGLYLVRPPYNQQPPDPLALAPTIYGPSYVSFHSSLEYHGWIPESVHVTMSATAKRSKTFLNFIGEFRYIHIPARNLFSGVAQKGNYLIADPWKAVADYYYAFKRSHSSLEEFCEDLRVERETIDASDKVLLKQLSEEYPSIRVRKSLTRLCRGL